MRFILTANGFEPTDGAIIPNMLGIIGERATDFAMDNFTQMAIHWVSSFGIWFITKGIIFVSEGLMIYALFCFLMAITGKGSWMESGVKSLIGFALTAGVAHAV